MKIIGNFDGSLADITSVVAGTGLSGGGTTGAVTLNVDASIPEITTLAGLTSFGAAGATTNIVAGDLTMFNPVTNGNPTISLGVDANERLQIRAFYKSGTQELEFGQFSTFTAETDADRGAFRFTVDETNILHVDDDGIDLYAGKGIAIAGTDILTDSSGTATLSNIAHINIDTDRDSTQGSAGAEDITALHVDFDRAVPDSGTYAHNDRGIDLDVSSESLGTSSLYGMDIDVLGRSSGTSTAYGIHLDVDGADTNIGMVINTAGTHLKLEANADVDDYATFTVADTGDLTIATVGDGTRDSDLILDADGDIKLEPVTGNKILLDGTIEVDAGVVTGATSITSTAFVGDVTGDVTGTAATVTGGTQAAITSCANLATVGTIGTGVWNGTAIGGNYIAATQPNIDSIGTDGDVLAILGDSLSVTNTTTFKPVIALKNQTDDASGPILSFTNQRVDSSTQAGEDSDLLGRLHFEGYDDAGTPNLQSYARIDSYIHDATDGQESGKIILQVANHDGGLGTGLVLQGGSANNEVDATIGLGAGSETLVSGNVDVGGNCNIAASHHYSIDDTAIISDSSGTATLSNIDAIDATTEATIEAAIETRLHYPFTGYCLGISSGNFQYAEDMTDNQFPVQLATDYGDTVIANGSLDDVSTWFRSSGTVMPRACTAIDMVGWASCPGTGEVTISLCKITPGRNSTAAEVPIVVATTTFTALNSNDKLEDFSVGDSGGDGTVTIVTSAIAKGDILMPFVLSPNTKTTYFNMTLEVTG